MSCVMSPSAHRVYLPVYLSIQPSHSPANRTSLVQTSSPVPSGPIVLLSLFFLVSTLGNPGRHQTLTAVRPRLLHRQDMSLSHHPFRLFTRRAFDNAFAKTITAMEFCSLLLVICTLVVKSYPRQTKIASKFGNSSEMAQNPATHTHMYTHTHAEYHSPC
ncbi:hypothetical protein B0J11DRAFT_238441 [Dendryphion nanum]|uniref:Uncharacterized protein n=1 Tax=Dendryphion nanum TaxID=256645 RepID=A0A9P9CXZ9_9PLEO|nr:hypothetical protein B0J11DRAFT_238441 [Dendryphion nanum]